MFSIFRCTVMLGVAMLPVSAVFAVDEGGSREPAGAHAAEKGHADEEGPEHGGHAPHIGAEGVNTDAAEFKSDLAIYTFIVFLLLLVILWMLFSAGIYLGESGAEDTTITSYGKALYWGVAAFSTAGIADMPVNGISELLGALWIVLGSVLFFGAIVATVTAYFMRPLQRPSRQIVDTIEYNLEQLDDLPIEELELLKETIDSLIEHVERLKAVKTEQISAENSAGKSA